MINQLFSKVIGKTLFNNIFLSMFKLNTNEIIINIIEIDQTSKHRFNHLDLLAHLLSQQNQQEHIIKTTFPY